MKAGSGYGTCMEELVVWLGAALALSAFLAGSALVVHVSRFRGYHRHKGLPEPDLGSRAVVNEVSGLLWLGWWSVRAWLSDGLRRPPEDATGPVVVAIHGYSQNASNMWGVRRALEDIGRPTVGISMLHRWASLPRYVARVEAQLDRLSDTLGDQFEVVAHSMGAIVLRMLLERRPDLRQRIGRVVTLGAPNRGTPAVRGFGPLPVPEMRAMHRRSPLLGTLPSLRELLPEADLVTVAGTADTIVYPPSTSLDADTTTVLLPHIGHASLLTAPSALQAVREAFHAPACAERPHTATGRRRTTASGSSPNAGGSRNSRTDQ